MADFCLQNYQLARKWHLVSEYLICLEAKDQEHLNELVAKAHDQGLQYTAYQEPDLDDAITAIVLYPSAASRKFASNLPLAGRSRQRQELAFQIAQETEDLYPEIEIEGREVLISWNGDRGGQMVIWPERYSAYTYDKLAGEEYRAVGGYFPKDGKGEAKFFEGRTSNLKRDWPAIHEALRSAVKAEAAREGSESLAEVGA